MAKQKQTTGAGASAFVVLDGPPKGATRVLVRVRRSGRTMRVSTGEARALHAIRAIEYVAPAPKPAPAPVQRRTYQRRDLTAEPTAGAVLTKREAPGDGEA